MGADQITKAIGAGIHHKTGGPDYFVVRHLALGSLPAAALMIWFLSKNNVDQIKGGVIMTALGVVLIITSIVII
ncbi:MAG: sulfite exporter TauE/SafE family protein, partial [Burkholderiales bacterium]